MLPSFNFEINDQVCTEVNIQELHSAVHAGVFDAVQDKGGGCMHPSFTLLGGE